MMDAPPDKEDLAPFVRVAQILLGIGLNVPMVLARDMRSAGFCCCRIWARGSISMNLRRTGAADRLYADALAALRDHADRGRARSRAICRRYDRALLMREMELMPEWFLRRHLGMLQMSAAERAHAGSTVRGAVRSAPWRSRRAFVHRDYHSRNLLLTAEQQSRHPGFSGCGARTRDLRFGVAAQGLLHRLAARAGARTGPCSTASSCSPGRIRRRTPTRREFMRWFDLMGLQRHIKVLGIFARLYYRDGKPQYLKDLPRVLALRAGHRRRCTRRRRSSPRSSPQRIEPEFRRRAGSARSRERPLPERAARRDDSRGRARRAPAADDRHHRRNRCCRCAASR